jgi:hypothetical protein
MKKITLFLLLAFGISASAFAQATKPPSSAKQTEMKEVNEASRLRKTFEQKQLNASPEILNDGTANANASKKKSKCKKKARS